MNSAKEPFLCPNECKSARNDIMRHDCEYFEIDLGITAFACFLLKSDEAPLIFVQ